MSDSKYAYDIVAFNFSGQDTAKEKLKAIKASHVLDTYLIEAQAIVEHDQVGKVHVHEPGHGAFGAASGAALGGLLGILGGPVGLLTLGVAGAALGGMAGHHFGQAIPKEDLEDLGEHLVPDSSALLLLIEASRSKALIKSLQPYDANVVTLTVGEDLSREIASYSAAGSAG